MMRLLLPSAFVLGLFALPARAQSFNVDVEDAANPNGPLPPTYGAAAQLPGHWNEVSSLPANDLATLDGSATSVGLATTSHPSNSGFGWIDNPGTSGDDKALLDDFFWDDSDSHHLVFSGLAPGEYDVYTYVVTPPFNACYVEVLGSPDGVLVADGSWTGSHAEGRNYVRHRKTVSDGTIDVRVSQTQQHGQNLVCTNGLQIVKIGDVEVGVPLCFGDGTGASCPCANSGAPGRGCENSIGTGGAWLFARGTTSPDTIVLQSSGELPSALSIFLQGNASIHPVLYGDGLRCTGGTLRRLYTKSAVHGAVTAPGPGDPSITVRSAQLGVPIPPVGRRYYQVYYRDPNPAFCSSPPGNTFNVSNAVKIDW